MDAARVVKGQGWPLYDDPRSDDGVNEPGAKRRAGWRGKTFWFLLGRLPKGTRPAGRNQALKRLANRYDSGPFSQPLKLANPMVTAMKHEQPHP